MRLFALTMLLAVTAVAYWPGLNGGFKLDDHVNLVANKQLHISSLTPHQLLSAATSGAAGPTGRPVSMASFAVGHVMHGLSPSAILLTNLILHLLTGLTTFWVLLNLARLLRRTGVVNHATQHCFKFAFLGTLIWVLSPMHVSTVLYAVQRMSQLAALFACLAIGLYLAIRLNGERTSRPKQALGYCGVVALIALAYLSKENGVLAALIILSLEIVLAYANTHRNGEQGNRRVVLVAAVVTGIAVTTVLVTNLDRIASGYLTRDFSLIERLWTECRIVVSYAWAFVVPIPAHLSLYSDHWTISQGPLSPPTSLLSATFLVSTALASACLVRRFPLLAVGVFWFLIGHLMESSIIALELRFEHRNYFPSIGLAVLGAFLICQLQSRFRATDTPMLPASIALALLTLLCIRSINWSDPLVFAYYESDVNPHSIRAQVSLANALAAKAAQAQSSDERNTYLYMAEAQAEQAVARSTDADAGTYLALVRIRELLDGGISTYDAGVLLNRYSTPPAKSDDVFSLVALSQCVATQTCAIDPKYIVEWHAAILANGRLNRRRACLLNVSLGSALGSMGKLDQAIDSIQRATRSCPDSAVYHIQLALTLAESSAFPEAMEALARAEEADQWNIHADQIQIIRERISSILTNT